MKNKFWFGGAFGLLALLLPGLAAAAPEIQHWTTANGARVYFVSTSVLPIVDVQVVFDAGSARDGGKPGLAQLTNLLLESGTQKLSPDAVAERIDEVGAQLGTNVSRDMASLSLRSLSDGQYLTPAVDTVAGLLREPAFAAESLERERNRLLTAVRERAQSPSEMADLVFYRMLYGEHPYASPPEGDEAGLNAIAREDIEAFHRRYYVGANAVVAIVGDLDRPAAERLADTLIGGLPAGEAASPIPAVKPVEQAQTEHVPFPSRQSHVLIGQTGISRHAPDYYSLYLGNHVLGGNGLVSRLADEVRQARGLSYSVYSYFLPLQEEGPFVIGLQTRNDQAAEAVEVARETLRDFVQNGPDPERLEMARQNITGGFALRIDSNSKIVQHLAAIGFYRLPLDYLQAFPKKINALRRNQVSEAFRRHIDPDRLITVIVGGAEP